MTRNKKAEKVKWKTVSLPGGLADEVQKFIDGSGYWPSLGSFAREACLEKLRKERQSPERKIVSEPILAFNQEERKK